MKIDAATNSLDDLFRLLSSTEEANINWHLSWLKE